MKRQTVILVEYNKATRYAANATAKSAAATESSVGLLERQGNFDGMQLTTMKGQLGEMQKQGVTNGKADPSSRRFCSLPLKPAQMPLNSPQILLPVYLFQRL